MKKFMSFVAIVLFASCVSANPPAGTSRTTNNGSGGKNYYSSKGQYLGRSTSNFSGGLNYYNRRGGTYNQTNKSGTTTGKFQAPSNGSIKSSTYSSRYSSKSSSKSSSSSSSSSKSSGKK